MAKLRQLSFNLGLDATPAEIPDIGTYGELIKIFNSIHTLATKLEAYVGPLPVNVEDRPYKTPLDTIILQNIVRIYPRAAEVIADRGLVGLNTSGEAINAQSAVGGTNFARGICIGGCQIGDYPEVVLQACISGFTGLVPNTTYFLSTTAGALTDTPPGGANIIQPVGYALTSTQLYFHPEIHATN
jgi:hypothetical protein